jgi:hypothetical protein
MPRTLAFSVFERVHLTSTRPFLLCLHLVGFSVVAVAAAAAAADFAVSVVHLVLVLDPDFVGSENSAGTDLDHWTMPGLAFY